MNIAGMRIRIIIQKNETVVDKYGNHRSAWMDYFSCWASASKDKNVDESTNAGTTTEENRLNFTVRWSTETAMVNTKGYRILVGDQIYNIVSVDEQGFRKKSRKFITKLSER